MNSFGYLAGWPTILKLFVDFARIPHRPNASALVASRLERLIRHDASQAGPLRESRLILLEVPLRISRAVVGVGLMLALLACLRSDRAHAQGRLEAHYTAALAGIPLGVGTWVIDIGPNHYLAHVSGRATGLLRLIGSGEGTAVARGNIHRGRLVPSSSAANITTSRGTNDVQMSFHRGNVKDIVAQPPMEPGPDRVAVTEAHRHGVLDPITAGVIAVAGTGEVVGPAACERRIPVFDGHQRFDLVLSFKRMDTVRAEKGYQGPVVVCAIRYRPIAGHRPDRYAVKYLQEQHDIEAWLAPIAGTRVVVPYRISVPTLFGTAVLEATRFEWGAPSAATTNAKGQTPARVPRGS
jgi:hypothetical protein